MSTAALQALYGIPTFAAATVVVTGTLIVLPPRDLELNEALFMPPVTFQQQDVAKSSDAMFIVGI